MTADLLLQAKPTFASAGRPQVFYPSHLTAYLQCPERYYHRYVARHRVEEPFSPNLARGIAAHSALAEIFETRRLGGNPGGVRPIVESHLPRGPYPSDIAWQTDIEVVCRQVEFALTACGPTARILLVERTVHYNVAGRTTGQSLGGPDEAPFSLRARLDLLVEIAAGHGEEPAEPVLVAFDWKAGGRVDYLQSASIFLGLRRAYPNTPIRIATVLVGERRVHMDHWERTTLRATYRTIRRTVAAIRAEETWAPEPSPLCAYCAFDGAGCSLTATAAEDDEDEDLAGDDEDYGVSEEPD